MSLIGKDEKEKIIEKFARHVSSGKVEFFKNASTEFVVGKREGAYLFDIDGTKLIDCHSNGGVFNLGHRNKEVIEAVKEAMVELDIGNQHPISEHRALAAEKLAEISPGSINRVVFGVSGGEAIDTAIKIARAHTKRAGIISAEGGYHGHTGFALPAGDPKYSEPFKPLAPGYSKVPFGDTEALAKAVDENTAAVLFETIPATLGIVIPPDDYFKEVRRITTERGALMIIDEVQTGLGRCGDYWGINTYNVVPDIIVSGKGLSGGIYPITAVLYKDELNEFLHQNPFIHISTFGGAEIGCYAAIKVVEILRREGFLEHIREIASIFKNGFKELSSAHKDVVVEVRQVGMMMGIKMINEMCAPLISFFGFKHGIFTVFANNDTSVSQILPPLIINSNEASLILEALDGCLLDLEKALA
ncbi:MAG: aminotransferase class III-fold pyridoxal phosphate-dependent enzyme [Actinomycetota bacterium]|nr:aminotransferase class III-fold pyridoxal phosphate-dependent enzyme [Actinomycetota bacterium]